ncbi:HlyD family efflux transporter periplasmic adaptor subunit [Vibrio salinus]|uniref:HlyD family efflux transporter periplasmic adaptor subunit n=1 Tax=Vibrio salinus TaxID=2899784 RepID=UPI001E3AAF33|nr:HlyD family efflux transporter periplasmic adaptor subunit [Vibrio salinus]MCE0495920.1 HlyD family efflux transporter periplasmic adaptor subunit [Vibrio salinus]
MISPPNDELPLLRQELRLYPAPESEHGSSRWTLEDPIRGRFYQLGWLETEFLANWSISPQKTLSRIYETTTLRPNPETLNSFLLFLRNNHLVQTSADTLIRQKEQQRESESWLKWLFRYHLAFRVPLCEPDVWLGKTLPVALPFMSRFFFQISVLAAIAGFWLASRQWESFIHGFSYLYSAEGAVISVITIILVKVLHELGHAFTCKRYGARVSTIGIMFILFWPVLYTDVSGAWRLKSRQHRIMIGAAGIFTEMVIAAWALLIWNFTDEGIVKSVLFTLSTTSLFLSLSINLSPLMRFDGYFILSDWCNMPNMQPRAFAMARWAIRKWMFGWKTKPPERFSAMRTRGVVIYALSTWIYRCTLYFSIALAVYHLVFKTLGILLFSVEIAYFLIFPLVREVRIWLKNYQEFHMNVKILRLFLFVFFIFLFLFVPWHHTVYAPAVLMAKQQQQLFVAEDAMLTGQYVNAGDKVVKGQLMFILISPKLDQAIEELKIQSRMLEKQILFYPFDKKAAADLQIVRDEFSIIKYRLNEQKSLKEKLTIRAPYSGVVVDLQEHIAGSWMAAGTVLGRVVGEEGTIAEAYINERDIARIGGQNKATFIPDDIHLSRFSLSIDRLARGVSTDLSAHPELSSSYGGPVATKLGRHKRIPVPQQAIYQVYLSDDSSLSAPLSQKKGAIVIKGKSQSIIHRMWNGVLKVAIRESVM